MEKKANVSTGATTAVARTLILDVEKSPIILHTSMSEGVELRTHSVLLQMAGKKIKHSAFP